MFSERYARLFWTGLGLNLWVSFASTFLAAVFALFAALAIRKTFFAKTICNFIYSLNLPMPHLVVAVGMIFVFSQSGLLARFASQLGFINSPGDFREHSNSILSIKILYLVCVPENITDFIVPLNEL